MLETLRRSIRLHGLQWLWVLACLLPLAQATALSHAATHGASASVAPGAGQPDDPQSVDNAACGLCLAAAHLGSGAAPTVPQALPSQPAPRDWAGPSADQAWHAGPAPVYRSRAPPFAPR